MADIEHKNLPEAQLHEPKGVSIASAGDIYVANGAGSGSWTTVDNINSGTALPGTLLVSDGAGGLDFIRYQGWGQYEDSRTTVGVPSQTLSPGVRTKLINNGLNAIIEKLPSDAIAPLWNTSTNKHEPISAFDVYHIRVNFKAENYGGTDPYIDLELDIGGGIGSIKDESISLRKSGAVQSVSHGFPVYAGATYLANGGEFYLTYTGTGTCDIYKTSLLIIRESKNFV